MIRLRGDSGAIFPLIDVLISPTFGYSVQLHLSLIIERFGQAVDAWDNAQKYDYRTAEITTMLTKDEMAALAPYLHNYYFEPEKIEMYLYPNSGFFPAGPDMGDNGIFTVSIIKANYSAMRVNPFGFFDCKLQLLFHDLPPSTNIADNNTAPDTICGDFYFGDVLNLRDPEISPKQEFATKKTITYGGGVGTVRTTTSEFTTQLTQRANTKKMSALVAYIQNTMRGGAATLDAGKHYWLFGPNRNESGQVKVRLLDNTITLTHEDIDLWKTSLSLWDGGNVL